MKGYQVLTQDHVNWYLRDICRARKAAFGEIQIAKLSARRRMCPGCQYCTAITIHRHVVEQTCDELSVVTYSLSTSCEKRMEFPKIMYHDHSLYRGFLTDTGEYIPVTGKHDHASLRKEYAAVHGLERAYKMIHIHPAGNITQILFCDRKAAPSHEQYTTLRELMIDAEGSLSFHFELETTHPQI